MVEVDSTYYRLPAREMVERWAERTPDGFVMHVKAFGVMTRHPVKVDQLPPDLRDEAPADERGRLERPSREFRAEIFRRFLEALEPLRSAGKLGGLLFQFPPYVVPKEASYDYLGLGARAGRRRQDARRVPAPRLVRGGSARGDASLPRGARHGARRRRRAEDGGKNVPLTVLALTTPLLYVRLHGRNADTWNVRGGSASERFDYLYSEEELGRVGRAAEGAVPEGRGGVRAVQQQQPQPRRRPRSCSGADERRNAA